MSTPYASWPPKAPRDRLDYSIDWASGPEPALALGENIATVEHSVTPAGELTIDDEGHSTTVSTVWLSAGDLEKTYKVNCTMVSDQNRTFSRTVLLQVRDL